MGKVPRIFVPEEKNTKRYTTVSEWRKKDNMEIQNMEKKWKLQFHLHDAEGIFESSATGHMFKPLIIGKTFADLHKEVTDVPFDSYFNVVYKSKTTKCFLFDIEPSALKSNMELLQNMVSELGEDAHPKVIKDVENMRIQCLEVCATDILANPRVHEEEPIAHTSDLPDLVQCRRETI